MIERYISLVEKTNTVKCRGRVRAIEGMKIVGKGPISMVGELCKIYSNSSADNCVIAEVIGLKDNTTILMPYSDPAGIQVGDIIEASGRPLSVKVSDKLLGRVLNARGEPIDDRGNIPANLYQSVISAPPDLLKRKDIDSQIVTGIRAIDGLLSVGKGQRVGIFAGSGVGKSTLLGMIARNTNADVNVIALIGERGREVSEFIKNDLGIEGLKRSVIIVSTSDTPAIARYRGAYVAVAIAEYFRDQGKDVMLLFDSVTRFARALREIGLSLGEAPATRGFTPSVFSTLPKLLERCGTSDKGTITGFFSVLVEGDDMDEPVSDTVRGILDGHIVLDRKIAQRQQYPAIDVLNSVSRLANKVVSPDLRSAARKVLQWIAAYREAEDLINVGAYVKGSNPDIDMAIEKMPEIRAFLSQQIDDKAPLSDTVNRLFTLADMEVSLGEKV
ncbi:FliI/YscN family ATPase [Spirochaetia bacterium 38H-sp]|uniref:FliI/YscN family ATPase n=1 Tax=Rarispira pelagica TaxID=3141764 RepID=A0ABU9UDY9_9SPIR